MPCPPPPGNQFSLCPSLPSSHDHGPQAALRCLTGRSQLSLGYFKDVLEFDLHNFEWRVMPSQVHFPPHIATGCFRRLHRALRQAWTVREGTAGQGPSSVIGAKMFRSRRSTLG